MVVWKGCLFSGHARGILKKWGSLDKQIFTVRGHLDANAIFWLVVADNYLFGASSNGTIMKWNEMGHCLATFKCSEEGIFSFLAWNGELYIGQGILVKRLNLEGEILEQYEGHKERVDSIMVWRGALLSVESTSYGSNLIQWTPFLSWSPSMHKHFPKGTRQTIKTMMLLFNKKSLYFQSVPRDVLFSIFCFSSLWLM